MDNPLGHFNRQYETAASPLLTRVTAPSVHEKSSAAQASAATVMIVDHDSLGRLRSVVARDSGTSAVLQDATSRGLRGWAGIDFPSFWQVEPISRVFEQRP